MPLHDHFRPPLNLQRQWHAFHNTWAAAIAAALNQQLPEWYFAEPNVQFGIEVDVATLEAGGRQPGTPCAGWAPPVPTQTLLIALITDVVEILVYNREGGPVLAGAIELVSPANKDRPAHRDAFVTKCAAYLQRGIGLIIVDVVTGRKANLHNDLLNRLQPEQEATPVQADLLAVAYRPVPLSRDGRSNLEIWQETLAVGNVLPTMPLWLPAPHCIAVDLEATYERTCRELRILGNGA